MWNEEIDKNCKININRNLSINKSIKSFQKDRNYEYSYFMILKDLKLIWIQ